MAAVEKSESENSAIRARYEELAQLAGSLAHEIKNPLSVIHMNIELLSEELTDIQSPIRRRVIDKVEIIRQQCERMESLLRDFLRYTRLAQIDLVPEISMNRLTGCFAPIRRKRIQQGLKSEDTLTPTFQR